MSNKPQEIGHGVAGCVYRPALPCKNIKLNGYVSKIIKKKNLITEYNQKVIEKLKNIDPNEDLVIRPRMVEICEHNTSIQEAISSCTTFQENAFTGSQLNPKNVEVLYQKNAGNKTLENLIQEDYGEIVNKNYKPSDSIQEAIKEVISIEKKLLDDGLTHTDIGLRNVVIDSNNKIRFIDIAGIQEVSNKEVAFKNFIENLKNSRIDVKRLPTLSLTIPVYPLKDINTNDTTTSASSPKSAITESTESESFGFEVQNNSQNSQKSNLTIGLPGNEGDYVSLNQPEGGKRRKKSKTRRGKKSKRVTRRRR